MASPVLPTIDSSPAPPPAKGAKFVEYDEFIETQLRKTRSQVRSVDLAAGLMVLVAGTLAYFFIAGMIDHWVVRGGLGFWGRLLLLIALVGAAGWWIATQIVPLLIKRINPLYAAFTIERSRPSLKNSLVNFLLFRSDPSGVHQRVLEAIEEQAATDLVGVPVEAAVDRTPLVRLGYVLVGLVALCAIYAVVSPKNLFQTVGRVVMPWSDITPPTSTLIDEIEPGSAQAFRGQQVTVKARVQGLPADGKVLLYYTTADGQIVDRAVEMNRVASDYRHAVVLPAADGALQQSLTYRIEAGDARSRDYTIEVVAAPTIVVRAVEYKYPAYTGLLAQRVERQGDLKAIEGTEITLEALANQPIASAYVDFDCDDTLDLPLRGEDTSAKARFRLALAENREKPEHASYQLSFKNATGQRNPQPVKHQIEVTRDLAPEVQFVTPSREEIELPLDGAVDLEVVAVDPDFALARVTLSVLKGQTPLVEQKLLEESWRGQFLKKYRLQPSKLKLAVGDTVEYFAAAVDNKSPRPNQAETARRRIRVVAPSGHAGSGNELAARDPKPGEPTADDVQQRGNKADPGATERDKQGAEPGESGMEPSPEDQSAERPGEPQADPSQDGQEPQEPSSAKTGKEPGAQPAGESQQGESNDGQSGQEQAADGESGAQPAGGEKSSGEKSDAGQSGSKSGERSAAGDESGEGAVAEPKSVPSDGTSDGDAFEEILKHRDKENLQDTPSDQSQKSDEQQQGGQPQPGGEHQEQKKSGQPSDQQQKSGSQEKSNSPSPAGGQQQSGDSGQSGQQANGKQPGAQQQAGDGQAGDKQAGKQSGDSNQPAGKSGEQKSDGKPGDKSQPDDKSQPGEKSQTGAGQKQDPQAGADSQASNEPGQGNSGSDASKSSQGKQQGAGERERGAGQPDEQQPGERKSGEKGQGQKPGGQQGATPDNNTASDGTPQKSDTQGQGAQAKDDPTRNSDQQPQQSGEKRPDAKGGDGDQAKGESGAGQKSNDQQGSPHAQDSNQPREKSGRASPSEPKSSREGQEQSPSTSKRESDSEGQEDGDRSGGGQRGGGQKSNQSGTGGAGQNTAADEGAGQSDESGDGETSDRAGDDKQAAGKTGQSGKQSGAGSRGESGGGNKQQPGGESAGGDQAGEKSQQASGDATQPAGGAAGGESPGATSQGSGAAPSQQWKPGVDAADKANIEYTRKATDLALDHLKHELDKEQPDPDLLNRLGWTRQQAEEFVRRWEAMRAGAQAPDKSGSVGRRQLDDALRSLGLRPRGAAIGSNAKRDDRTKGYQESQHTTPPAEYSEAFKAYTQGTARGGK